MSIKGTTRGHCQVCGRIHVVLPSNLIAKHGYKVAGFGFFNGVCSGADYQPLELDRTEINRIINSLTIDSARRSERAKALRNGTLHPEKAQELVLGVRQWKWIGERPNRGREPVMVPWSEASPREREAQIKLDAGELESYARHAFNHAKSMIRLAADVHGKPLIDRNVEELAHVAAVKAKTQPIEGAYRTQAAKNSDLEKLNRKYSFGLSRALQNAGVDYMDLPFDLHHFNPKRYEALVKKYPNHQPMLAEVNALYAQRVMIKARPVIK